MTEQDRRPVVGEPAVPRASHARVGDLVPTAPEMYAEHIEANVDARIVAELGEDALR